MILQISLQLTISGKNFNLLGLVQTPLTMDEVNRLQKGLDHKPFNPSSKAHIAF